MVNLSSSSRIFTFYNGPADDPQLQLLKKCGPLRPGGLCIGFQGATNRHYEIVDIVSTNRGTPTTEHHITVR